MLLALQSEVDCHIGCGYLGTISTHLLMPGGAFAVKPIIERLCSRIGILLEKQILSEIKIAIVTLYGQV